MDSQLAAETKAASVPVWQHYYELTKPGITQMVALTGLAGYYLALPTDVVTYAGTQSNWWHFLAAMVGIVTLSAGSGVVNHLVELNNDRSMKRTALRPLPAGTVSVRSAIAFAALLTAVGIALLWSVNLLTCLLGVVTWVTYVALYTPMKQRTRLALYVGGIPGALPFAGGWTAVTGSMDSMAWVLFGILFFWQLPHFLALSWMYRSDYADGGFVMHATSDSTGERVGMLTVVTSVLTMVVALLPTIMNATGWLYGGGVIVLGLWLTRESVRMYQRRDHASARRVLVTSYAVLMGVVALMLVDKIPHV